MPANTAWICIAGDEISDYCVPRDSEMELEGLARVYKLGTPRDLDGDGILDEYVLIRILYRREAMHAEIALFPCDETGCIKPNQIPGVARRMGSFPLVPCPKGNPDAIEFAIGVAFNFYNVSVIEPPEPEPEPEPEVEEEPKEDNGLDYDPDDIPTYD